MEIKSLDGRIKRTYHLEPYQVEALKTLSPKTRIKQVDFIREAVDRNGKDYDLFEVTLK